MPQGKTPNIDEVVNWLENLVNSFNFLMPGIDQSLGRDLVNAVAWGIADRSATELRGADGTPWPENSDNPPGQGYKSWKARNYGVFDMPNFRTGQMLSLESLKGRPEIDEHTILMHYGTGDPPQTSAAPTGYLSDEDQKITDVEKAQFAHASDEHRPARPFYELDDDIRRAAIEVAADALAQYLTDANNS